LIISNYIQITTNSKTLLYYQSKGYKCLKKGEKILVSISDLKRYSREIITLKCDYCGEVYYNKYCDFINTSNFINKQCCKNCLQQKAREVTLKKYNGKGILSVNEFNEKRKATNLKKYGVEQPSCLKEFQDKAKATTLKKYGVQYGMQSDICKQKSIKTSMEKYGVKSPMQNAKVKENQLNSVIKKYGKENSKFSIREIIAQNIKKINGKRCSAPQLELWEMIGGQLNYPVSYFSIDIAFPDDLIAVEYDGSGHKLSVEFKNISQEDFDKKEEIRTDVLIKNKYNIIRYITNYDKNFDKETNLKIINYCKNIFNNQNVNIIKVFVDSQHIEFNNTTTQINSLI
jgi:hypothetical protein